jgi:hypothetical protein
VLHTQPGNLFQFRSGLGRSRWDCKGNSASRPWSCC